VLKNNCVGHGDEVQLMNEPTIRVGRHTRSLDRICLTGLGRRLIGGNTRLTRLRVYGLRARAVVAAFPCKKTAGVRWCEDGGHILDLLLEPDDC
jgi:hypothetical protein